MVGRTGKVHSAPHPDLQILAGLGGHFLAESGRENKKRGEKQKEGRGRGGEGDWP